MHTRILIAVLIGGSCGARSQSATLPTASDATRHRAALASVVVANQTAVPLSIAFRTATPPLQEVVIGRVAGNARGRMAPIPAGEPIILVARRDDGAEFNMPARSFLLDVEFVWDIPKEATFQTPPTRRK